MDIAFLNERSDSEILARVQQLVHDERRTTAALVAHLAEFESRKLYLREGCASMFIYCTRVLHFSEHAAYRRIAAARLARRFPAALVGLERGDVHETALEMLGPHLTPENHRELLASAKHKTKREILELIAGVDPKPDVAASVRKAPVKPATVPAGTAGARGQGPAADGGTAGTQDVAAEGAARSVAHSTVSSCTGEWSGAGAIGDTAGAAPFVLTPPSGPRKAEIVPLAPERYKIQFTASAETCNKLRRAQELLRHRIPNGDFAAVVDRALDLLVQDLERKKFAATNRPRRPAATPPATPVAATRVQQSNTPATAESSTPATAESSTPVTAASNTPATGESNAPAAAQPRTCAPAGGDSKSPAPSARSRHIPAGVKRNVWQRDDGRCTFLSPGGARCNERGQLEFDHIHPYGDGGDATAANIRLLCRAHNQYEAEQFFGVWQARNTRSGASR